MAAKTRIDLQRVRRQTKRWSTENVEKTTHHKKVIKVAGYRSANKGFFSEKSISGSSKLGTWTPTLWLCLCLWCHCLCVRQPAARCPHPDTDTVGTRHRHPSLWPHAAGRSQRQTPAVRRRCQCQQAAAARTALWSYTEGGTDPGILDWCPGCRLCAGPHPPCPHTPRDLGEHGPAQHTEDPAAVQHSATSDPVVEAEWLCASAAGCHQPWWRCADTGHHQWPQSCHRWHWLSRASSPVTARCKYKKKTKHQPPSRVDYLLMKIVILCGMGSFLRNCWFSSYCRSQRVLSKHVGSRQWSKRVWMLSLAITSQWQPW